MAPTRREIWDRKTECRPMSDSADDLYPLELIQLQGHQNRYLLCTLCSTCVWPSSTRLHLQDYYNIHAERVPLEHRKKLEAKVEALANLAVEEDWRMLQVLDRPVSGIRIERAFRCAICGHTAKGTSSFSSHISRMHGNSSNPSTSVTIQTERSHLWHSFIGQRLFRTTRHRRCIPLSDQVGTSPWVGMVLDPHQCRALEGTMPRRAVAEGPFQTPVPNSEHGHENERNPRLGRSARRTQRSPSETRFLSGSDIAHGNVSNPNLPTHASSPVSHRQSPPLQCQLSRTVASATLSLGVSTSSLTQSRSPSVGNEARAHCHLRPLLDLLKVLQHAQTELGSVVRSASDSFKVVGTSHTAPSVTFMERLIEDTFIHLERLPLSTMVDLYKSWVHGVALVSILAAGQIGVPPVMLVFRELLNLCRDEATLTALLTVLMEDACKVVFEGEAKQLHKSITRDDLRVLEHYATHFAQMTPGTLSKLALRPKLASGTVRLRTPLGVQGGRRVGAQRHLVLDLLEPSLSSSDDLSDAELKAASLAV